MAHTFNIVETIGRNSRLRGESWLQRMVSNSCPLNLCPSGTASLGAVQRAIRAPAHIAIWAIHAPSVVYERLPTPYPSAINVVTPVQSCRSSGRRKLNIPDGRLADIQGGRYHRKCAVAERRGTARLAATCHLPLELCVIDSETACRRAFAGNRPRTAQATFDRVSNTSQYTPSEVRAAVEPWVSGET